MADPYAKNVAGLDSPAENSADLTPDDGTDLTTATRALWVGVTGSVKVTLVGGTTVTFASVPGGTILPVRVARLWATGTSATNLLGLW
jgi:hypothetical protein